MKLARAWNDARGTTAIEFGLTAPIFFAMLFGFIACAMLLWTQTGLQHATEMAARCATINKKICSSTSEIQTYAAMQTLGLNPPPSTFTVSTPACGNQVSASYEFPVITSYFGVSSLVLSAQSCFPK